jgi:tRNA threonylcarbamoyl adenosine modification protein YeaZ
MDSATPAVTAALVEVTTAPGVRVLAQRTTVDARAHGELLAPQLDAVLREAGARPRDVAAVVAGLGPGPFTGLRVGLVTAAALSQALDIPTYGVCSLDALALGSVLDEQGAVLALGSVLDEQGAVLALGSALGESGAAHGRDRTVLVATDARRREVYWGVYRDGSRVTGPAVDGPALVAKYAAELGATAAIGEGAHRYADVLGLPVRDQPRYPPPAALAALAADRVRTHAASERLTPLYLRRPDAVQPSARKPALR